MFWLVVAVGLLSLLIGPVRKHFAALLPFLIGAGVASLVVPRHMAGCQLGWLRLVAFLFVTGIVAGVITSVLAETRR